MNGVTRVITIGDRFKFRRPVQCWRCGVEIHSGLGNSVGAQLDRRTYRLLCADWRRAATETYPQREELAKRRGFGG